ncbi:MAG: hypothetical protein JRE13_15650, partial [Deltaproteobacteria bacterium]|nr:hypothetical protein [Deltaproteobacteria bacterium]
MVTVADDPSLRLILMYSPRCSRSCSKLMIFFLAVDSASDAWSSSYSSAGMGVWVGVGAGISVGAGPAEVTDSSSFHSPDSAEVSKTGWSTISGSWISKFSNSAIAIDAIDPAKTNHPMPVRTQPPTDIRKPVRASAQYLTRKITNGTTSHDRKRSASPHPTLTRKAAINRMTIPTSETIPP